MATSTDIRESTQIILNDIQKICENHFPGESNIENQLFEKINVEIKESDAELVIILKQQLGNVLTYVMENLDNEAQKKSSWFPRGSSSRNRPNDAQRDKVKRELESVIEKAKCLKESVIGDHEIELVGREKEKKEIIDELMLLSWRQDRASLTPIPVIIIWGISGIGKTKLALHVCQDYYVTQNVGLPAWVSGTEYNTFDVDSIANHVSHNTRSSSGNIIVVLDDWSVEIGDQDVKALQDKLKNVKAIMITTRNPFVAMARDIAASPLMSYCLPVLDETESVDLFNKTLGRGADLGAYSSTALEQCSGVPRAIIILAEWLNSPRSHSRLTTFTEELIYSYYNEGLPHLCFAYFSLFPQDYSFDAETLIQLWIAEGFLNPLNPSTRDLVGRSIFEEVEFDEFGEVRSCGRMQPLMHDMARFMADRENITMDREGQKVHRQVQRASFDFRQSFLHEIPAPLFDKAKDLKSLLLFKNKSLCDNMSKEVLRKVFKSFKRLCVLELSDLEIKELPSSIGEVKDLKYLNLSKNKMEELPSSITKLSKLETLKLFYCYLLKELPKDFKKLAQLKHLDVEGCTSLTCMPHNISKMSSLQTLSAFVASKNDHTGGLEELAKLNQLRGHMEILHLERVQDVPETNYLEEKQYLEHLKLQWDLTVDHVGSKHHLPTLNRLKPNSALRALILEHYRGPRLSSWLTYNHLECLVKLSLQDCHRCKYLSKHDQLPRLEILELVRLENLEYITQKCDTKAVFYTNLKELNIEDCPKLKSWWQEEQEFNNRPLFASLSKLCCPELTCMPRFHLGGAARYNP